MKLSIIIPLYNKEKYFDRCIGSLLAQDLKSSEYEIIIVDDGSTDSSFSIAKNYAAKYENIHSYSQKNGGPGTARNKGLESAKGDYVYFLDADDYIASNVLKSLLKISELNKLEVLGFNTKYVSDGTFTDSLTEKPQDLKVQVTTGMDYIANNGFRNEAWWYIIKKSFLIDSNIKFIEGRFLEDSIFTASLFLKAKTLSKVNFDVHRFVKVENSATTNTKPTHTLKFINDLVFAIEKLDVLIKSLDSSKANYIAIVKAYNRKKQAFAFSLLIKAFRCPILKFYHLKKILFKLNKLGAYPINPKMGVIGGSGKTKFIYNTFVLPVFNNKVLLFLGLRVKRLIFSN